MCHRVSKNLSYNYGLLIHPLQGPESFCSIQLSNLKCLWKRKKDKVLTTVTMLVSLNVVEAQSKNEHQVNGNIRNQDDMEFNSM